MGEVVVRAVGLSKTYGTGSVAVPVLHGIDLTVHRGECVFLVGPSGSGKTTLLSILGCVLSADEGHLEILGDDVTRLSRPDRATIRREKIGFVFQRFHLIDALTALENVRLPLDLLGRSVASSRDRALQLLSRLGLADKAASRVNRLSMGQRQRVALARAMAADPELILADEPTASLDADAGPIATRCIKELCREFGKTAIVVTHDERILPLADRILKLRDGRIDVPAPARP